MMAWRHLHRTDHIATRDVVNNLAHTDRQGLRRVPFSTSSMHHLVRTALPSHAHPRQCRWCTDQAGKLCQPMLCYRTAVTPSYNNNLRKTARRRRSRIPHLTARRPPASQAAVERMGMGHTERGKKGRETWKRIQRKQQNQSVVVVPAVSRRSMTSMLDGLRLHTPWLKDRAFCIGTVYRGPGPENR